MYGGTGGGRPAGPYSTACSMTASTKPAASRILAWPRSSATRRVEQLTEGERTQRKHAGLHAIPAGLLARTNAILACSRYAR